MILKSNPNFEEKLFFCLKIDMKNLVNFNRRSGKSEYLSFDGLLLLKVCNVWAKTLQRSCVTKNGSLFQKWHNEFGQQVVDKSSVYIVLAERMYFFNKGSPSNFNFLDCLLFLWSCPNSLCGFWKPETVLKARVNFALFCKILAKT